MSYLLTLAFCVGLGSQHCYTMQVPHEYQTKQNCDDDAETSALFLLQNKSQDTRYAWHTCEGSL